MEHNEIKKMMEEVHNTSFLKLLEFREQVSYPVTIIENDDYIRIIRKTIEDNKE